MDGIQAIGTIAPSKGYHTKDPAQRSAAIDHAAREYESVFFSQMLQPMFEGMKVDPVFGGGHGEEVMKTFLVQEYGKIMAKNGHLGIADAVKTEMIRAQAAATGGASHVNAQ